MVMLRNVKPLLRWRSAVCVRPISVRVADVDAGMVFGLGTRFDGGMVRERDAADVVARRKGMTTAATSFENILRDWKQCRCGTSTSTKYSWGT